MGQPDPVGFGRQSQQAAIGVKGVGAAGFDELERGFLAAIDQSFANPAIDPEHQIERVGAESRDLNHLRNPGRIEAAET